MVVSSFHNSSLLGSRIAWNVLLYDFLIEVGVENDSFLFHLQDLLMGFVQSLSVVEVLD
jgi:hypothetical protein